MDQAHLSDGCSSGEDDLASRELYDAQRMALALVVDDLEDAADHTSVHSDSSGQGLMDAQHLALACAVGSLVKDEVHRNQNMMFGDEDRGNNDLHGVPATSLERSTTTQQRLENEDMQAGRDAAVQIALGGSSHDDSDNDEDNYKIYTTMHEERLQQKLAWENGTQQQGMQSLPAPARYPVPQPGAVQVGGNGDNRGRVEQTAKARAPSSTTPGAVRVGGNESGSIDQNSKARYRQSNRTSRQQESASESQEDTDDDMKPSPGVTQEVGDGLGRKGRRSRTSGAASISRPLRQSSAGIVPLVTSEIGDGLDRKGGRRTSRGRTSVNNTPLVTQEPGDGLDRKGGKRISLGRTSVTQESGDGLERKGRRSRSSGASMSGELRPSVDPDNQNDSDRVDAALAALKSRTSRPSRRSRTPDHISRAVAPEHVTDEECPSSVLAEQHPENRSKKLLGEAEGYVVQGELVDDDDEGMKARVRNEMRHEVRKEIDNAVLVAEVLEDQPHMKRRRRCCMFFCAMLIAIAVVVGVLLGRDTSEPLEPVITEAPSFLPTEAPSSMPTHDAAGRLFQVLDEAPLSFDAADEDVIGDQGNSTLDAAGRLAMTWLLSDAANGTVWFLNDPSTPDWKILQLFIITKFYFSMNDLQLAPPSGGDKLLSRANFLTSADVCSWNDGDISGVFCNSDGQVSIFKFASLSLKGDCIPAEFGIFTSLQELWLNSNACKGTIPSTIGLLSNLVELSLERNEFSGTVPTEIGHVSQLNRFLFLADNNLSGTIPTELGKISGLQGLHLHRNRFTGPLPSELGNFRRLEKVQLFSNELTGSVPPEYAGMIRLQEINLISNSLAGTFPVELINRSLKSIRISENEFFGSLPTTEFQVARNLEELDLDDNQFGGELPTELGLLTKLQVLALGRNEFTGTVPSELSSLSNLDEVFLEGNLLSGNLDPLFCGNSLWDPAVVVDCCLEGDALTCSCCNCSEEDQQNGCE